MTTVQARLGGYDRGRAVGAAVTWIGSYGKGLGLENSSARWGSRRMMEAGKSAYMQLVIAAGEYLADETCLVRRGLLEGISTDDELWEHYETLTGVKWLPNPNRSWDRGNFFSCSC